MYSVIYNYIVYILWQFKVKQNAQPNEWKRKHYGYIIALISKLWYIFIYNTIYIKNR